jgi:hypothetical protein
MLPRIEFSHADIVRAIRRLGAQPDRSHNRPAQGILRRSRRSGPLFACRHLQPGSARSAACKRGFEVTFASRPYFLDGGRRGRSGGRTAQLHPAMAERLARAV